MGVKWSEIKMSEYTNQIACRVALPIIICINNTQCHSWGNSMNIKRLKETGCFLIGFRDKHFKLWKWIGCL